MSLGGHREVDGFEKIVRLSMVMNPSGKRKYFGNELLSSLQSDERIVYATSNCGNHEVTLPGAMATSFQITGSNR
jgi:hypothetical protein